MPEICFRKCNFYLSIFILGVQRFKIAGMREEFRLWLIVFFLLTIEEIDFSRIIIHHWIIIYYLLLLCFQCEF